MHRDQLYPLYFQVCKRLCHVFIRLRACRAEVGLLKGNEMGEFISAEAAES